MRIKKHRTHETVISYILTFSLINPPKELRGAGFGFECDKDGNVDVRKLHLAAQTNYKNCLEGKDWRLVGVQYAYNPNAEDEGHDGYRPVYCTGRWEEYALSKGVVEERKHTHTTPAVGECNGCGRDVELHGFTNTCACGIDYNMSGQQLAHRSQWGEETGESVSDILGIDYSDTDALFI